jgi:hypothetical protein
MKLGTAMSLQEHCNFASAFLTLDIQITLFFALANSG